MTLGLEASFCAEGEEVLRVRARISKGAEVATRASITAPPCLPVAPTMRSLRSAMMEFGSGRGVRLNREYTRLVSVGEVVTVVGS